VLCGCGHIKFSCCAGSVECDGSERVEESFDYTGGGLSGTGDDVQRTSITAPKCRATLREKKLHLTFDSLRISKCTQ